MRPFVPIGNCWFEGEIEVDLLGVPLAEPEICFAARTYHSDGHCFPSHRIVRLAFRTRYGETTSTHSTSGY